MGVCNSGVPVSSTQCNGAGYSWDYLNCTQTAPTTGVTSATCSLPAPSAAGNYNAVFFSNNTYSVLASAPFGVTVPVSGGGGSGGNISIVQAPNITPGGGLLNNNSCSLTAPAVGAGDAVVGFLHGPLGPTLNSVTDNAGNTYTKTASVRWQPYSEKITVWYLANVQGSPTTFTFNFSGSLTPTDLNFCNMGFVEYAGASNINAVVGPIDDDSSSLPSITITPTTTSMIWGMSATDTTGTNNCAVNSGQNGDLTNTGYIVLVNNCPHDGIGVFGSPASVPASPVTLSWTNSYWNASVCADGSQTTTGCSTLMAAAAIN
jgi:hypothetical protein